VTGSTKKESGKRSPAEQLESLPSDATTEVTQSSRSEAKRILSLLTEKKESRNADSDARALVQKAYEQLNARKQSIETELARIEALRAEYDTVTAQVVALDEAMKAFQQQDQRQRKAG